jgi:hypothetical protein
MILALILSDKPRGPDPTSPLVKIVLDSQQYIRITIFATFVKRGETGICLADKNP